MDDLVICSSSPDPLIAAKTAQKVLDHLEEWFSLWRLPVSSAKYESSFSTDPPSSLTY